MTTVRRLQSVVDFGIIFMYEGKILKVIIKDRIPRFSRIFNDFMHLDWD